MAYIYRNFCLSVLLFGILSSEAQTLQEYFRNDSVKVNVFGIERKHPWTGGFNNPQFSPIDLNKDGFDDLFVFERDGNRVYTFLNDGIQGQASYTYAPHYEKFFPPLKSFALLRDYNCDGKLDLFSKVYGGVTLYKNTTPSGVNDSLSFEIVHQNLPAMYYGNPSFVSVISGDIPAIYDVDGDGDLDILTFHQTNTYVTFFENVADDCDSVMFKFHPNCYGGFYENLQTYQIILEDSFCMSLQTEPDLPPAHPSHSEKHARGSRHIGGNLCAFDPDNDGLVDLLIGDIESPIMKAVYNTGTPDTAYMTSQDTMWPSNTIPVNVPNKTAAFLADVNNDGLTDILVSPSDQDISEDVNNVLLYENIGTANNMELSYTRNNFINRHSIDLGMGSYPRLVDVDNDGLSDILIGNTGYFKSFTSFPYSVTRRSEMTYFKNIGTAQTPEFDLVTNDFSGLGQYDFYGMYPAFGDLDGDGDLDMVAGNVNGKLMYFENNAPQAAPMNLVLSDSAYMNIDIDTYTHPALFDLNGDSLLDLIVGTYNGVLYYYQNIGTATQPHFNDQPDKDTLGGLNLKKPGIKGMTAPYFAPFPADTSTVKLIVGIFAQSILVYDLPADPVNDNYTLIDSLSVRASHVTPVVGNLGGDAAQEIIYGQFTGGLTYLQTHEIGQVIPEGACCLPDSSCIETTDSACAAQNGTYYGDNVSCNDPIVDCGPGGSDTGACCLPDESCIVAAESGCIAQNGDFQGAGTKCNDNSVNCSGVSVNPVYRSDFEAHFYPNPFDDAVNVHISSAGGDQRFTISVYNTIGERVRRIQSDRSAGEYFEEKIDMSEFPGGMYLITVENGDQLITNKVIKK